MVDRRAQSAVVPPASLHEKHPARLLRDGTGPCERLERIWATEALSVVSELAQDASAQNAGQTREAREDGPEGVLLVEILDFLLKLTRPVERVVHRLHQGGGLARHGCFGECRLA